jgi:hypothetical protein
MRPWCFPVSSPLHCLLHLVHVDCAGDSCLGATPPRMGDVSAPMSLCYCMRPSFCWIFYEELIQCSQGTFSSEGPVFFTRVEKMSHASLSSTCKSALDPFGDTSKTIVSARSLQKTASTSKSLTSFDKSVAKAVGGKLKLKTSSASNSGIQWACFWEFLNQLLFEDASTLC